MAERYLVIAEVSQKQSYIFNRNELKINVRNSSAIAMVTESEYFKRAAGDLYSEQENLVYAGGGHSVLEFTAASEREAKEKARRFCRLVTLKVYEDFPDITFFTAIMKYDEGKSPSRNLRALTGLLEDKKNRRLASFHQGSFGIEMTDSNSLQPVRVMREEEERKLADMIGRKKRQDDRKVLPDGFVQPERFAELGGTKDLSNFIAVVHIDGNGMGNRVSRFYEDLEGQGLGWEIFRARIREFSEQIDKDFKASFKDMTEQIAGNIRSGRLDALSLQEGVLPVRRIITSGDDICYVAEGRIGIESAAVFLRSLAKKTGYDGKPYAACAGVCLIHQKYPFYRAYELAEELCRSAKSYGAKVSKTDDGASVSAIDWHIEFGEMQDSLEEIRRQYETADGNRLEMRPYVVCMGADGTSVLPVRMYNHFRSQMASILSKTDIYPAGKLKELRTALKKGEEAAKYYLIHNHMYDVALERYQDVISELLTEGKTPGFYGSGLDRDLFLADPFVDDPDEKKQKHSTLFDVVELMDTFLVLEEKEAKEENEVAG